MRTVAALAARREFDGPSSSSRATLIAAAGIAIIALGAAAALSPTLDHVSATSVFGLFLAVAGLLEIMAGKLRHETQGLAMLAGLATVVAGALLVGFRRIGLRHRQPSSTPVPGRVRGLTRS